MKNLYNFYNVPERALKKANKTIKIMVAIATIILIFFYKQKCAVSFPISLVSRGDLFLLTLGIFITNSFMCFTLLFSCFFDDLPLKVTALITPIFLTTQGILLYCTTQNLMFITFFHLFFELYFIYTSITIAFVDRSFFLKYKFFIFRKFKILLIFIGIVACIEGIVEPILIQRIFNNFN